MIRKKNVKRAAAAFLGLALAMGGVGCANFIKTDSEKDLAQTVATVNISQKVKADAEYGADVGAELEQVLKNVEASVSKRDLVASFLSTGYQYVESYGYTYKDTFELLVNSLVSREIMIQYAIAYYLKTNTALSAAGCEAYCEAELQNASDKVKKLYEANPEVLTLKYFLTEGGADVASYDRTVYQLKKSLNDSLDSLEATYIKAESEEHDHGEARTLPTGVNTEKEDYYDTKYEVFTGRNGNVVGEENPYERVEGSTTSTRQKAYNAFLANLQSYGMIRTTGDVEDTSVITEINYYYVELASSLGQALINKYFKALEKQAEDALTDAYVQESYDALVASQQSSYENAPSALATAMESVSDTAPIVYGLKNFGYVYNILLPFSKQQEIAYTREKNNALNTQDDLYNFRKKLLTEVKAADQRGSWISEHDHANYSSFDASTYTAGTEIKFFEEDISGSAKYEKLKQYAGNYPYYGIMEQDEEGEWKATPSKVDIKEFIALFEEQINLAVDGDKNSGRASGDYVSSYDDGKYATVYEDKIEDGDYSQFTYYTGTTNITATAADYFNPNSDIYKAISAVNELMFAYSTDTGCLNKYYGYAVSPYGTDFVKEFEFAAQAVVANGAGSYAVCATDYGWHIVYASFVYTVDGDVYGGYNAAEKDVEGTFSNMYYESLKTSAASNRTTAKQNEVLNAYNNDGSVTLFEKHYKDLLNMD